MLFFAYCGFVFVSSFVGYFLNADRYSRLAWLLFWGVPTGGVLALGWAALAAFIPAALVGAIIFWRSPRSSFTDSDGLLRDEQIGGARGALGLEPVSSGLNVNPATPEGRREPYEIAKPTPVREASPFPSGPEDNLLVKYMTEHDVPLTRENYLNLAWPDGPPTPWTAELEAELPECIRASLPAAESDSDYVEMTCYTYRLQGCDPLLLSEQQFHAACPEDSSAQTLIGDANDSSSDTTSLPKNVLRMPNRHKWPGGCGTPFIKP